MPCILSLFEYKVDVKCEHTRGNVNKMSDLTCDAFRLALPNVLVCDNIFNVCMCKYPTLSSFDRKRYQM